MKSEYTNFDASEYDQDPSNPEFVAQLLNTPEWSGIPDIIKMMFSGTIEVMRAHYKTFQDQEKAISHRASKNDLQKNKEMMGAAHQDLAEDSEKRIIFDEL